MNIINPAYAGSREALSINLLGRTQWVGIEAAPKTATLAIHSPLNRNPKIGLGFSGIYDQVDPLKESHFYADFSYKINTSYNSTLSSLQLSQCSSACSTDSEVSIFSANLELDSTQSF